ncbi:hypothetical protein SAMN04515666_101319 [Bosea lupini]|uniref:Uncharacterized protein n=1 Tax=Bosea lupini TaxID=1036779 RepID=A0A1H7GCQ1_9HYPH|nr:hypothetical protein [Bosea lupini]SEK35901.1 hypothetical protein SAMN04515666_101319 [Bosea lupini]
MSQQLAQERAKIAELREAVRVTANDPPIEGVKLMMSAEDIAAIRGCDADTVRDKHRSWTKKNGFPQPIPGMLPLVWSGPKFMAWLRGEQAVTITVDAPQLGKSYLQANYGGGR